MSENDKELLLKDLSTRLPYQLIVRWNNTDVVLTPIMLPVYIENCKPYLRPLSSMTDEEKEEQKNLFDAEEVTSDSICYLEGGTLEEYLSHISYSFCSEIIDWLNARHFDYRSLIERGLAIAVTEENNPYKE